MKPINSLFALAVFVLLPVLMLSSLIGQTAHEILGLVVLLLGLCQLVVHRHDIHSPTGAKTRAAFFSRLLCWFLVGYLVLTGVTGILLSESLFHIAVPAAVSTAAARIHLCLVHWGLVLIGLHMGLHLPALLTAVSRRSKPAAKTMLLGAAMLAAYGAYFFIRQGLYRYLLLTATVYEPDAATNLSVQLLGYLATMVLFALVSFLLSGRKAWEALRP